MPSNSRQLNPFKPWHCLQCIQSCVIPGRTHHCKFAFTVWRGIFFDREVFQICLVSSTRVLRPHLIEELGVKSVAGKTGILFSPSTRILLNYVTSWYSWRITPHFSHLKREIISPTLAGFVENKQFFSRLNSSWNYLLAGTLISATLPALLLGDNTKSK